MRALSNADLLDLWERGSSLHPMDRGLLALHTALAETSFESLADWPLGRRNQALAELRCSWFGARLEAWTACPRCGEKLEFQMDARTLAADAPVAGPITVKGQSFRFPTSRDLARSLRETAPRTAAVRLLESCRLDAGEPPTWSEQDIDEIGEQMALGDPLAETRLSLDCPACANQWDEALDISAFLWTEIDARARRLLLEIHALASTYGWTERQVLSLSEARRAVYLEMCHA